MTRQPRRLEDHPMHTPSDLGDDLVITKMTRRLSGGGTWVKGRIAGHRFEALVFPEHAQVADYEIADSRISKLWLQRLDDKATVYHWDRGQDLAPQTPTAAAILDFLAAGLAESIYDA